MGGNVTSGKEYCQVTGVESCHVGKSTVRSWGWSHVTSGKGYCQVMGSNVSRVKSTKRATG